MNWLVVEDTEGKAEAYLHEFNSLRTANPVFKDDQIWLLVFDREFSEAIEAKLPYLNDGWCFRREVRSLEDINEAVAFFAGREEDLIVILDVQLKIDGDEVVQDKLNVAETWRRVEERPNDDLICVVTSEYYRSNITPFFPKKGVTSDTSIEGDKEEWGLRAKANIVHARQEWIRRYEHPGKKYLHALMLAQAFGSSFPGHIIARAEIYPEFPFIRTLLASGDCLSSFKSLFYRVPAGREDHPYCDIDVLIGTMKECGVGCDIVAESGGARFYLPMSPGALYLFRLCYLLRLLRDEQHDNPVVKIGFFSLPNKVETRLHFNKPITGLANAFDKPGRGTVAILKTFEKRCVPMTPPTDETLKRIFENAKMGVPPPLSRHVESVCKMEPLWLNGSPIKVDFEDRVIVLRQVAGKSLT